VGRITWFGLVNLDIGWKTLAWFGKPSFGLDEPIMGCMGLVWVG